MQSHHRCAHSALAQGQGLPSAVCYSLPRYHLYYLQSWCCAHQMTTARDLEHDRKINYTIAQNKTNSPYVTMSNHGHTLNWHICPSNSQFPHVWFNPQITYGDPGGGFHPLYFMNFADYFFTFFPELFSNCRGPFLPLSMYAPKVF